MDRVNGKEQMGGVLNLMADGAVVETIPLEKDVIVIGRARGDIILDDSEISSSHCKIQTIGQAWHLFDLNSTNGTYLNGQKIVKGRLNPGDRVRVGKIEMVFAMEPLRQKAQKPNRLDYFQVLSHPSDHLSAEALEIDALIEQEKSRYLSSLTLVLDVVYCDGSKERLEIPEKACILGRTSHTGRFHVDEEMSRKHARVSVDSRGQVVVEDLRSTNGTYVNSEKILGMRPVDPADEVRLGDSFVKAHVKPR